MLSFIVLLSNPTWTPVSSHSACLSNYWSPNEWSLPKKKSLLANFNRGTICKFTHLLLVLHNNVFACKGGSGNSLFMSILAMDNRRIGGFFVLLHCVPNLFPKWKIQFVISKLVQWTPYAFYVLFNPRQTTQHSWRAQGLARMKTIKKRLTYVRFYHSHKYRKSQSDPISKPACIAGSCKKKACNYSSSIRKDEGANDRKYLGHPRTGCVYNLHFLFIENLHFLHCCPKCWKDDHIPTVYNRKVLAFLWHRQLGHLHVFQPLYTESTTTTTWVSTQNTYTTKCTQKHVHRQGVWI